MGFEPTQLSLPDLKTGSLDHSDMIASSSMVFKTIFGVLKDIKYPNNSNVEIIFRSESFNVRKNNSRNSSEVKGKIIAVKYVGYNTILHLDIKNNNLSKHIHIKISGKFVSPKNKICYISIDKKYIFIFNSKN